MTAFIGYTITLLSAAFSLGGTANLYLRFRTRVLGLMLLFLLSLFLISAGLWCGSSPLAGEGISEIGMAYVVGLLQLLGIGLNIMVLPHLISALISIPIPRIALSLIWLWNGLYVLAAVSTFLLPQLRNIQHVITAQQVATIIGSLIFGAAGVRNLKKAWWRRTLISFFIISLGFLFFLVLDILITILPIPTLHYIDNLSLPVYVTILSVGIFHFSGKYLSQEPLIKTGKLTPRCLEFYKLTHRESEIIEELIQGRTNKELADRLCISVKTVENHLYSIYQKTDVQNRVQLIHALRSWGSE